ncbi:hypothetical protein OQ279_13165 [Salinimicrobium sp. MT39]|uniref:DUF7793 domain-containing protein n=1 Tax=Salinimicrobium profundisediminis TaxID=2994553 RepID=A0A9X3D140_9FLAO|nr:hypothetical protein [Salinimicrobium profundisediminis]MCX2839100.1 hypothetical protein [Salinimicrobium profundisediminis]
MIVHKEYMENAFAEFWIENRILYIRYKPDIFMDIEAARLIVADRVTFQKGKLYPILCYAEGIASSTKPARDYLAIKGSVLTLAIAYIASPKVSLAMLHFFKEINKPVVPSEIFTSEMAARKFLHTYLS